MSAKPTFKIVWLCLVALVLSACGGKSNGNVSAANQAPPPAPQITNNSPTTEAVAAKNAPISTSTTLNIDQITFTDAKLANCVEATAKANKWTTAAQLNTLNCANKGINSIGGIQNLTSLKHLDLSLNNITTLTPLANLNSLSQLDLAGNGLVNIEPLANLAKLTHLDLGPAQQLNSATNSIRNISALGGLDALVELDLSHNQISDILPLQDLTALTTLKLNDNQIRDIQVLLGNFNSEHINLKNNNNITCASLNELEASIFGGRINRPSDCIFTLDILISDIYFADQNLKSCVLDTASSEGWITINEMTSLACDEQYLTDLTGLQSLKALNYLDLRTNQIIDIAPLFELTATANIDLSNNEQIACVRLDALQAVLGTGVIDRPANCGQVTLIGDLDFVDPALESCVRFSAQRYRWTTIDEMTTLQCGNKANTKIQDLRGLDQLTSLENIQFGRYLDHTVINCQDLDTVQNTLNAQVTDISVCRP